MTMHHLKVHIEIKNHCQQQKVHVIMSNLLLVLIIPEVQNLTQLIVCILINKLQGYTCIYIAKSMLRV